jgi:hypothetical protein
MIPATRRVSVWLPRLIGAGVVVAMIVIAWIALGGDAEVARSLGESSMEAPRVAMSPLKGKVRSSDGTSISSATVCAYGAASAKLDRYCATTDSLGEYFLDLVSGHYSVTASAAQYSSSTSTLNTADSSAARLDFELTPRAPTIAGAVKSAAGAPVDGASVVIYQGEQLVANVSSDAEGRFSAWTPDGTLHIDVDARGFASAVVQTVAPTMDVVVTLYPGNKVVGRVLMEGSLQPVPSVHVTAVSSVERVVSALRDSAVLTNERGEFLFSDLPVGLWTFTVADRRLWGASATPILVSAAKEVPDVTLIVQPAAEVSGRFVVGDRACEAGRLHLTPEHAARQGESRQAGQTMEESSVTGEIAFTVFTAPVEKDGVVRFDAVPHGAYRTGAICKEHQLTSGPASIEIVGDAKKDMQWSFAAGTGIEVLVVDESRQPIANASVSLTPQPDQTLTQAQMMSLQRRGTTDAKGKYRFGGLRSAKYVVSAHYGTVEGSGAASEIVDLQPGGASSFVTVTLPGSGSIHVHARTADGKPISRVLFFANDESGTRYEGAYRGDGRFVIGPLPNDHYRVYAYDNKNPKIPLNSGRPVPITSVEPVVIDFAHDPPKAQIEGRVTNANGQPQPAVLVRAVSATLDEADEHYSYIQVMAHGGQEQMTDQSGMFRIDGLLSHGKYDLYVDHPSGVKDVQRGISPGRFVTVALPDTATVVGTVTSADGKPVSEFDVLAYNQEANDSRSKSFRSTNGAFKLERVYPGTVEIAVYSAEHGSARRNFNIAPGQTIDVGQLVTVASEGVEHSRH